MLFRLNILLTVVLVIVSFSGLNAQAETKSPTAPAANTNEEKISFPYVADIIGTDVYIRSGPGTAYYFCRKANAPEKVTVVEHMHTWAKIIPPKGSFSWISKNYVDPDQANDQLGKVNADNVRVWAGSDYEVPMRSSSLQTKLNEGDLVTLMDKTGQGDYYKIVPPPGAYLWVSTQYLKYSGPVTPPEPEKLPEKTETPKPEQTKTETPEKTPAVEKPEPQPVTEKTEEKPLEKPEETPKESPLELKLIEQCKKIGEEIDAELAKPLDKQDFTSMKKTLKNISEDKDAGRAKLYADFQIEKIDRVELAKTVKKELDRQNNELNKTLQKIRKKRDDAIADTPKPGKHIVIGTLKLSQVYTAQTGQKRYTILNEEGKIDCYAIPSDRKAELAAQKLIGRKVGLVGKIASASKGPVSLIEFTEIEDLNDKK